MAPLLALGADEPMIAAPQREPVVPLAAVQEDAGPGRIARGATPAEVIAIIGAPDRRLSADAWVYWNYQANRTVAHTSDLDTLVVIFSTGRVGHLRLLPRANVEALAARMQPARPAGVIVAH